jgi:hypothetical protein
MVTTPHPQAAAFRALERRLARRRLLQLDPRLRGELALLALLLTGFLFWQFRAPLDGLRRAHGPLAVAGVVATTWLVIAVLHAGFTASRHARRLRADAPGPPWLSLPVDPRLLERHLAWESRARGLWVALPAAGVLAAAAGLVPVAWLALLAALFAWLWLEFGRLGCALGLRDAMRAAEKRPELPPVVRALASARASARRSRLPAARWRREAVWRALWRKDARLTARVGRLRQAALVPAGLIALSLLAWTLPSAPLEMRHFVAFVLAMLAAATLAEWLVALCGADPFSALRPLPVGVGSLWTARILWGVLGMLVLVVGHGLAARALAAGPLRLFLLWVGGAVLGIATLGLHYGLTLFPRTDLAQRLLGLSLGLAVIASLMFPLSGWLILLSAIAHSARRLPRWHGLEEA